MISITKKQTIKSIQEAFSMIFSGLQIRFYQKEHALAEGSSKATEYATTKTLGEITPQLKEGKISLHDLQTVAQFEQMMETQFGLHVQVFRRSGDLWLQTTTSDYKTLKEQNEQALQSIALL